MNTFAKPASVNRIRRWTVFGAKLIFGPLFLLTLVMLAIQFGAWRIEFQIAGPFAAETNPAGHSLILVVPNEGPAAWWRQSLIGDNSEKPLQSNLELRIDDREMGPPHTLHETIRTGKTTGFSHWGERVIFSLPPGVRNAPETIATLRYSVRPRAWVTLALTVSLTVASALLGWVLNRKAIRAVLSRCRTGLIQTLRTPRTARIVSGILFWPLALLTLVMLAIQFGAWRIEFQIAGPFAAQPGPAGRSLILVVPQEEPAAWWRQPLIGDTNEKPSQSNLELHINGRAMAPPHSQHEGIRTGKDTGFSHYGRTVIFSLPPGVENASKTIATLRYSVRPRAWVTIFLMVASALFGWLLYKQRLASLARRYGERPAAALLRIPYLILFGLCCLGVTGSAIYLASSLYAFATGWALPTTALIRWSPVVEWLALNEPYLGYLLLTLAGLGASITWLAGTEALRKQVARSERQSLRLLLWSGFPIIASTFILCISAMWAGLVRAGDPHFSSLGGLVALSDANGYLASVYDQVKDGTYIPYALRRPLAATFRSALLFFANGSAPIILILQACLLAAAAFLAIYRIAIWRGVWAAMAFLGLFYIYARIFAPTMLTEPLGLFWAVLSIPFFIEAFRSRSLKPALVAFAITAVALMTRMGSMFTIPALLVWLVWQFGQGVAAKLRTFAAATCILLAVFGLNSLLQKVYGTGPSSAAGNFAYQICGLTMGTPWYGCPRKLASEGKPLPAEEHAAIEQLYSMASENFRAQPSTFFWRLTDGVTAFVSQFPDVIWKGYGRAVTEPHWLFRGTLTVLALVGLLYTLVRRSNSVELTFWALFWASMLASSSIMYLDDGPRTIAASQPLIALFFAMGVTSPSLASTAEPGTSRLSRFGYPGLVVTAALLVCIPWVAHRFFPPTEARGGDTLDVKQGEAYAFGGRRMSGLLVVEDGARLRHDVPAIHMANFKAIVKLSGIEYYQGLLDPVAPSVPFGFVFAPPVNNKTLGNLYIVPIEVLDRPEVAAWRFQTKPWDHKQGTIGRGYWSYVTKAAPLKR